MTDGLTKSATAIILTASLGALPACKDQGKESAARAAGHAASLAELVDRDVAEVERGLPEGAHLVAALMSGADAGAAAREPSPVEDASAARAALRKVRRDVADLAVAKSTFFAVADAKLVGVRNDLEQDVMAGLDLGAAFPGLTRATAQGVFATSSGVFPGVKGDRPDRDWVAAAPIKRPDGTVAGALVTGWSYRYFARHLQESLLKDVRQKALTSGDDGKIPILYVAVFDATGVYTAPLTPPVNDKALVEADLVGKTAPGAYQAPLDVTGRTFGLAAVRAPRLGPDTGIAVLRSEI